MHWVVEAAATTMGILEGRALEECEGGDEEEQSGYGTGAGGEGEDHVRGKRDILSCR